MTDTHESSPGHRPTTLKMASKHCPFAITLYQNGTTQDRSIFHAGTSAHACIQAVREATQKLGKELDEREFETITGAVCERMIREGRKFEGDPEPPLPADRVWEGRDLARQFIERNPIVPVDEDVYQYHGTEVGLAVDAQWNPMPYLKDAHLRLIADCVEIYEQFDEEDSATVLEVHDYKTAWPTDESELDTLQMKSQAVLAVIHFYEDQDIVRQRVTNLRTGVSFTRDLWMNEDGEEILERWRKEIDITMRAYDQGRDEDGNYAASPGGGCIDCPFLLNCEHGKAWMKDAQLEDMDDKAVQWAVLNAAQKELGKVLRKFCDGGEFIDCGNGHELGWVPGEGRDPDKGAIFSAWEEWKVRMGLDTEFDDSPFAGFLATQVPSTTLIDKMAKAFFPEPEQKAEREEWAAGLFKPKTSRSFKTRPKQNLLELLRESVEGGES